MSKYGWGVDGFGRQHICIDKTNEGIVCVLPGNSVLDCIDILEERNIKHKENTMIESVETQTMTDEKARKFKMWFDSIIGTDCYQYGGINERYFICCELTENELKKVHAFLRKESIEILG